MRLVTYLKDGQSRTGFLIHDQVIDLITLISFFGDSQLSPEPNMEMDIHTLSSWIDVLRSGEKAWGTLQFIYDCTSRQLSELPQKLKQDSESVTFLPPIQRPGKVLCIGLNYPPMPDAGSAKPAYPIVFHKVATALTGHQQNIILPSISNQVEYEGELTIVIGKQGKKIAHHIAEDWIAGYTIGNDIGAVDVQARSSQWTSGKMFDTFCPLGPAIVSREEVPDPDNLKIRTQLNGENVQEATTAEMYYSVSDLVSYISTLTTLEPGDIILTGSPKRAGARPDPRTPLKPGDTIRVEIEHLGELSNPVVAEEE